jgi:hypothetical protein
VPASDTAPRASPSAKLFCRMVASASLASLSLATACYRRLGLVRQNEVRESHAWVAKPTSVAFLFLGPPDRPLPLLISRISAPPSVLFRDCWILTRIIEALAKKSTQLLQ